MCRVVETVTDKQLSVTLFNESMNNIVDMKVDEFDVNYQEGTDRVNKLSALLGTFT